MGEVTMDELERIDVDRHTFFAGLMLALCARGRRTFPAEGEQFHQAFLKTVEKARENLTVNLVDARWIQLDPVFKVVPEANEMVLEAEHDHLVALLNPRLRTAQFKIDREQAGKELRLLAPAKVADWFDMLGEFFDAELPPASA